MCGAPPLLVTAVLRGSQAEVPLLLQQYVTSEALRGRAAVEACEASRWGFCFAVTLNATLQYRTLGFESLVPFIGFFQKGMVYLENFAGPLTFLYQVELD